MGARGRGAAHPGAMRLGLYVDGPYAHLVRPSGSRVACDPADLPFLTFAGAVAAHFDERVIFARVHATELGERSLLPEDYRVVPLPDYGDLYQIGSVLRAAAATTRAFWSGLAHVDVVWAFGPNPFALILAVLALVRGKRVVLGIRQDTPAYFAARLPTRGRTVLGIAARLLDLAFRGVARLTAATVVGSELAKRMGGPGRRVLPMTVSLMRADDVARGPQGHEWNGTIELLTVGRIDREKNPMLLLDAIAELDRTAAGRYRLTWVGTGPMASDLAERAAALDLRTSVDLPGFVPFGEPLVSRYRSAHAFVHVSLTEGVPAVLMEAMASGIPIVATAVGGVPAALDHGRAGLLVPPSDLESLVGAIRRLDDAELRDRLVRHGLGIAARHTLDAEAERVADFLAGVAKPPRAHAATIS